MKHIIWIIFLTFSINSQNIIPDIFSTNVSVFRGAELVSESLIKRKSGNMVFTLVKPYSQSIFLVDEQIYIQDDDFKQISLLKDQNSLPMLELFQNTHEFEPIECEEANCFINTSKIPGISTMVVVKNGDILEEIS